ncbi:cystathionine gamma-lyase [Stylonychia lemnae]|uniref:cystathionine gamma-lyase n=1 Tax=Stylonychia lemnae TaxID=5949 RepID=A0A078ATA0_STYLE|nr:cystathionine gamma-lyase [Stylonychia lemnae]|eukprot:CDW85424.1 cystathionine gamma-lyase [Stylonychia lemnae]
MGQDQQRDQLEEKLEQKLAKLENAQYCLINNSGVSALQMMFQLLGHKARIVVQDDFYSGTRHMLNKVFNERLEQVAINPNNFKEKLVELLSHQFTLKLQAILQCKYLTLERSPRFKPLDLGCDIVIDSCTKYICGHSDCLAGSICTNNLEIYQRLKEIRDYSFNLYLMEQGLQTFKLRGSVIQQNALKLANYLEQHPKVEKVLHPLLVSHPNYSVMKGQTTGYMGTFSFYLKCLCEFVKNQKRFEFGTSLGGVKSSIDHFGGTMRYYYTIEQRIERGYTDNFYRVSTGIEDVEDLIKDLEQALEKLE